MMYFRIRVPGDIRGVLQRTEIQRTLRTNNPREAGRKAQRLAWITTDFFDDIRGGKFKGMNREEILRLVTNELQELLEEDELQRITRSRPRNEEALDRETETLSMVESDELERLAMDDYKHKIPYAEDLLKKHGITLDKESTAFKTLCRELLKASISYHRILQERNNGVFNGYGQSAPSEDGRGNGVSPVAEGKTVEEEGPLLSEILSAWVKDKLELREWTERTRRDNEPMVRDFIEMVGDMPIGRLSAEHMRDARDRFRRIPKNRTQTRQYAAIPLRELSEMDIPENMRLSIQTLNNRAVKIGGFLNWAKERGYPVKDGLETVMRYPKNTRKKVSEARAVFSPEDLAKIFNLETYMKETKGIPSRIWVPLIALCTGMRLEEICQMYLKDIKDIDGILYFSVNDEGDKSVKTLAGKRIVPMSPVLAHLGFIRYLNAMQQAGESRVFPDLEKKKAEDKYGRNLGKWFGRYLGKVGVKDDETEGAKVFHSFRHTFINDCKQAGLETKKVKQIVGHEGGGDITLDHYGKAYRPEILYQDVILKIQPAVDLEELGIALNNCKFR